MFSAGDIVCPGYALENLNQSEENEQVILGPGLRREANQEVYVTKPGIFRFKEPNIYWVDSHQKRYVPVRSDLVIGIITAKAGDIFRVDIGGSQQASLSYLSFEGATKRNRPDVKVGDLVFARFLVANNDTEPELVCIDSHGRSNGMGVIRDQGYMFQCSLSLIRKILSADCVLLKTLGQQLPFEITVGMNGRVWVKGRSVQETIALADGICNSEFMNNDEVKLLARTLADSLLGF